MQPEQRQREPRVAVSLLRPLVRALVDHGKDYHVVLAASGLSAELVQSDARIPHSRAVEFAERVERVIGDPSVGLRYGTRLDAFDLGILSLLLASAPTVGAAIERVQHYGPLLHEASHEWGETRAGLYYWYMDLHGVQLPALTVEGILSATVTRLRYRAGFDWAPQRVFFRHSAPAHLAEHVRIFRCPVDFNAEYAGLVIDAETLALPNLDPSLISDLALRRADALLAELRSARGVVDAAREQVLLSLKGADIGADTIARRMHMSRSTLTRKLQKEGTTLSEIVDEVRQLLALEYLRGPELSFEEVARRLAFSDARAFRRAFVRWTGRTPADYRNHLRG